jgi:hypothetical protein
MANYEKERYIEIVRKIDKSNRLKNGSEKLIWKYRESD